MGFNKKIVTMLLSVTMIGSLIPTIGVKAEDKVVTTNAVSTSATSETTERRFVAYFTDWAYNKEQNQYYTADMMPWDKITHINYAFAKVNGTTNKIDFIDKAAATELEFPGQTDEFPYKGHFNVINSYKKKYPKVKSLISVGGWAASQEFFPMLSSEEGRETFTSSCVDFIREYGFDGVDIDFEYPTNLEDAGNPNDFEVAKPYRAEVYSNYCKMLKLLRQKLDEAGVVDGVHYLSTAAVTASAWVVSGMGEENFTEYLDYINLMTYDFHGSWNGFVAHNSPLYSDPDDNEIKYWNCPYNYLSTDWAVKYYSGLTDPSKIVVGIPYYTRGWENVKAGTRPGGLYGEAWGEGKIPDAEGTGATGNYNIWCDLLPDGTEEPGGSNPLWHAKNLLNDSSEGFVRYWDDVSKVPYLWNEEKKVFLSFEDEQSMNEKVDYIIENNLGGAMCWEIDGDFDYDETQKKYVVGDTLTTIAYEKFKEAGPIVKEDDTNTLPVADYDIEIVNNYDHPNNEYKIVLVNNTGAAIEKPATIEFDIPNCVYIKDAPWSNGATTTVTENGQYLHFKITVDEWGTSLGTGRTTLCEGEMTLRALGGAKNMRLNGYASKAEVEKNSSSSSSLLGAAVSTSTTDSRDGNYTVTVNVPASSGATSFDLYEGDTIIKSETVTTAANKYTYNITNKANGTYKYKVVMKNGTSSVTSSVVSVYVGPEIVLQAPTVTPSVTKSEDGNYTIKVSVPANSNGTTMDVYEGGAKIGTETITTAAKEFTYTISGKTNGTYTYKAILKNDSKSVESNTASVKVYIKLNSTVYDSTKLYQMGDLVEYEGKIYENIAWWTPAGTLPTNTGYWKYVCEADTPDVVDLATVASKYRLKSTDAGYDASCDINGDGIIDIVDIVLVAKQM